MNQPSPPLESSVSATWLLYICKACGLIYNEQEGDPDSGLLAGTRFVDIPEDWECPLCGVTKSDFELYTPPDLDALKQASVCAPAARPTAYFNGARELPGIVVVGAGKAGWQLIQNLRTQWPDAPITLVTECAGDVYDKPLLSVAMSRKLDGRQLVKQTGVEAAAHWQVRL